MSYSILSASFCLGTSSGCLSDVVIWVVNGALGRSGSLLAMPTVRTRFLAMVLHVVLAQDMLQRHWENERNQFFEQICPPSFRTGSLPAINCRESDKSPVTLAGVVINQ